MRLTQAGLDWSKRRFLITAGALGVGAFLGGLLMGTGLLAALGFAFAAGCGLPLWLLAFLKKRREARFLFTLPDAVDVIVRGIKAGLPLLDSLKLIAADAEEPVRSEFRGIIETQTIGMPLGEACLKLYERMPVAEANFFGIVVSIQQRAGGNLSEALGNLSRVLRDRKKMKAKIQAMSMEAKASASIIGALPIVVMSLVYFTSPDYIALLWTDPLGRIMLACCGGLDDHRRVRDAQDDQFRFLRGAVLDFFIRQMFDPKFLAMIFAAIAAGATVLTLAMPLLITDPLPKRMKAVALEREKIRQRERERMAQGSKVSLRQSPKMYMKKIVDNFNLNKWVGQEEARKMLVQAGYRGQAPYITYLFFRMAMPVIMLVVSLFYIFVVINLDYPPMVKIADLDRLRLFRHVQPEPVSQEQDPAAPGFDQARVPRCARSAADLRRIRHVDRSGFPQGQRGGRIAIGPARRGNDADDGGTVLSAGSPAGL